MVSFPMQTEGMRRRVHPGAPQWLIPKSIQDGGWEIAWMARMVKGEINWGCRMAGSTAVGAMIPGTCLIYTTAGIARAGELSLLLIRLQE